METTNTHQERRQQMLDILVKDLLEARDALTAATSGDTPLSRSELWRCADLLSAATQYAHRVAADDGYGAVKMIGEHHAR